MFAVFSSNELGYLQPLLQVVKHESKKFGC